LGLPPKQLANNKVFDVLAKLPSLFLEFEGIEVEKLFQELNGKQFFLIC
jgi:hypothetical protein